LATKTLRTSSTSSRSQPADYVLVAIAYAEEAIADRGGKQFGKWVRLAAKRFLRDLKRAARKRPPFLWSPGQANQACEFIEKLPHVEGVWASKTIKLEPAQVFFIVNLFGFRRPDGSRRFTTALLAVARKNGKSSLAAAILLYVFCTESDVGPQVLSAATTGDQARIVWGIAKRMVERDAQIREAFTLEPFANAIARYEVGGTFKPINAKASTQDGLNPSALSFDELHAHKSRDLYDVLRSAAGARKNPLFLYTTTEGYESPGPWQEVRRFAWQVLEEVVEADHFLALYYALDESDGDFDERAWVKANPLLGVSIGIEKMREYAKEARLLPGALAEFRIKRLNRPSASAEGWIDLPKWRRCGGEVPLDELKGLPCYAGLDLASTSDMTALRFVWWRDDVLYTWGWYWVPDAAVVQRNERGTVSYGAWVAEGWITRTGGNTADYRQIEAEIVELCERYKPAEVAFDRWNASQLVQNLMNGGLNMVEVAQGAKSYHPPMQALEAAYVSGKFRHGGDPVLQWNAANLVPRRDANMNMAPDRKRSADKIDGMCALLMAVGRQMLAPAGNFDAFLADPVRA